ncbi:Oidioi.mRNA.OKI2018_I69.PAR.g10190.t1.cds [Oikopleura dioica]|uniref:Oidioi.mRNA.OKI2018_I69.PAR.g10190.t1.cds n=1 Tax=Oikopleura dioica TaxID=34765 RepID=A0ABN7RTN5_OIKDI|nr:Oidioi.mRNA.OKI2018_I69.PAR.g10190.t1.cds [Oikopleura dioica]
MPVTLPKTLLEDDTPNFHAPKYAEYIWNDHAQAFVDYVKVKFSGNVDLLLTKTDDAIADIWNVLEDEEKTLSIISRHSMLSIKLRPKFMESMSTLDQINYGLHYIVQTLSFVHAHHCFINLERGQWDAAEHYIMQFENMSWWEKVIEQNKKYAGSEMLEQTLIKKVMDSSFNWLKSRCLENRKMFDNAIRMMKKDVPMVGWRYECWGNEEKRSPEAYDMSEEEKERRVSMLKEKKAKHVLQPFDKDAEPHLHEYRQQVLRDKAAGKLDSLETMLETGIFWLTVKCPKCARAPPRSRMFFLNPCKLCRQIQATCLLGHIQVDDKFFSWIFKDGTCLTEEDVQRAREEEERKQMETEKRRKLRLSRSSNETDKLLAHVDKLLHDSNTPRESPLPDDLPDLD